MMNASDGKKPQRKGMEIRIPLYTKEDRFGGVYYVAAPVEIDQEINLGNYMMLVLLGKDKGPGPSIVLRPRREAEYNYDEEDETR